MGSDNLFFYNWELHNNKQTKVCFSLEKNICKISFLGSQHMQKYDYMVIFKSSGKGEIFSLYGYWSIG